MRSSTARSFEWPDAVILLLFAILAAITTVVHDRDVREIFAPEKWLSTAGRRLDWVLALRGPAWRIKGDMRAFLAVTTLGGGLVTLRRPGIVRGRRWPSLGTTYLAVGGLTVVFSLATIALEVWIGGGMWEIYLDHPVFYVVGRCHH